MKIPYLSLCGRKVPRFMGGSIKHRMEICKTSPLPIPMVPRLHQSNGYIKRKLRTWKVQKSIALVGSDTVLSNAWPQTSPFHGGYRAQNGNMRKLGLLITMVPRLHQSNGYMKRKLRAWRVHQSNGDIKRNLRAWRVPKCIALVGADIVLTSSGPETTPFHGR